MAKYYYLPVIGASMIIIVFLIGMSIFKKLTNEMKVFVVLMGLAAITEVTILYVLFRGKSIQWPQNIYLPLQYALLSYIISTWQKSLFARKLILISIPIYILISTYSIFQYYHFYNFDNFSVSLSNVLFAIMSSYTLYIIQKSELDGILNNYRFWMLSGFLIYSAGNLTYFALNDLVFKHYVFAFYALFLFWNIIAYILYIIGMIRQYRERKLCGA